mmetsp:Transcript_40690/g.73703  ORF Transcript_40690/g.73703 Transcript_40690/m.73703 type:complete len:89 (-) Transcript_40690:923-1189(-)
MLPGQLFVVAREALPLLLYNAGHRILAGALGRQFVHQNKKKDDNKNSNKTKNKNKNKNNNNNNNTVALFLLLAPLYAPPIGGCCWGTC